MPTEHRQHDEKPNTISHGDLPACRIQRLADFASGNILASATPAEQPNQIIEPPKPTANTSMPQS
jgi:hypothetical protein